MVREISATNGSQFNPQIKRVSVRSNGAGANAGVVTANTTPSKQTSIIKDTVLIKGAPQSPEKR